MKFKIETKSYDTSKMNKYELRALVSMIKNRIARGEEAKLEAIRTFDTDLLEKIEEAKKGLEKILYEISNKI